jgi:hypothetical protein
MIEFIDNAEDRIVVEVDADWYERNFCVDIYRDDTTESIATIPTGQLLNHMGLPPNWSQTKTEYTGHTYILTMERLWI